MGRCREGRHTPPLGLDHRDRGQSAPAAHPLCSWRTGHPRPDPKLKIHLTPGAVGCPPWGPDTAPTPPRKDARETSRGSPGKGRRGARALPGGTLVLDQQGRSVRELLRGELGRRGARSLHGGRAPGPQRGRERGLALRPGRVPVYMPPRALAIYGPLAEGRAGSARVRGLGGRLGPAGGAAGQAPQLPGLTLGRRWRRPPRGWLLGDGRGAQGPGLLPAGVRGRGRALRGSVVSREGPRSAAGLRGHLRSPPGGRRLTELGRRPGVLLSCRTACRPSDICLSTGRKCTSECTMPSRISPNGTRSRSR